MTTISRSTLLFYFLLLFIISPKITAFHIGNIEVRFEDLILLPTLILLIWNYRKNLHSYPLFIKVYFFYIFISILSASLNLNENGTISYVYIIRQMQYLIWFYVGAQMAQSLNDKNFRKGLSIVSAILILWAVGEILNIIPKIGKFTGAEERITVNTSGPYEISVLVVIIFLVINSKFLRAGLLGILLASQSRISIFASLVVFTFAQSHRTFLFLIPLIFILTLLAPTFLSLVENTRIAETESALTMVTSIRDSFESAPVVTPSTYKSSYFEDFQAMDNTGDVSFKIRAYRWSLIVKSLSESPLHLLFGWGPAAFGNAVDGHYVRFLGETGIIGLISAVFFFLTSIFSKRSPLEFRYAIALIAITALFIDTATSSKLMSISWAIGGYYYTLRYKKHKTSAIS